VINDADILCFAITMLWSMMLIYYALQLQCCNQWCWYIMLCNYNVMINDADILCIAITMLWSTMLIYYAL